MEPDTVNGVETDAISLFYTPNMVLGPCPSQPVILKDVEMEISHVLLVHYLVYN